jgi:Icc protein
MPIHLPPISRRHFLGRAVAAGAGLLASRNLFAADAQPDGNFLALLSDTHIAADRAATSRNVNMADNLQKVAAEIAALKTRPAHVLVNGDCAYLKGEPADYATFVTLLQPIRAALMPVHMTLGNHDDRPNFWNGVEEVKAARRPLTEKHVGILRTPRANWFMLDSLDQVNKTPGLLGEAQLAWLTKALDDNADKPAIVFTHHDLLKPTATNKTGLVDTDKLLAVMEPRKHVKAYIYGHTHTWITEQHASGIHLLNLPPVAYAFNPAKPSGWVEAHLEPGGGKFKLNCLATQHKDHGQVFDLKWRAS